MLLDTKYSMVSRKQMEVVIDASGITTLHNIGNCQVFCNDVGLTKNTSHVIRSGDIISVRSNSHSAVLSVHCINAATCLSLAYTKCTSLECTPASALALSC